MAERDPQNLLIPFSILQIDLRVKHDRPRYAFLALFCHRMGRT